MRALMAERMARLAGATGEAVRPRVKGETTCVERPDRHAVDTANRCLVPAGIGGATWERLNGEERFYLEMLELEARGYAALSRRMKDKLDLFGSLPDSIDDDWIESRERLEAMMDRYLHLRAEARNAFELRHQTAIDPSANRWELCARVLSRRDVVARLSAPW